MPCWFFEKPEVRNTPSYRDGIEGSQELTYRREGVRFILAVGTKLGLRYDACATGAVYYHRFYQFHSFKEFPKYVTAACCLFLAGKVEETPKKCKDIVKEAKIILDENSGKGFEDFGDDPKEEVMTLERVLLQTIKFDLMVEHPYKYLLKFAKRLKDAEGNSDKDEKVKNAIQKMVQMAWTFINDSLCTPLTLLWEPDIIAVALMYLASRLTKVELGDKMNIDGRRVKWWESLVDDVTIDLLEDICHQVLDLYSEQTKDNSQKGKKTSPPPPPPPKVHPKKQHHSSQNIRTETEGNRSHSSRTDGPAAKVRKKDIDEKNKVSPAIKQNISLDSGIVGSANAIGIVTNVVRTLPGSKPTSPIPQSLQPQLQPPPQIPPLLQMQIQSTKFPKPEASINYDSLQPSTTAKNDVSNVYESAHLYATTYSTEESTQSIQILIDNTGQNISSKSENSFPTTSHNVYNQHNYNNDNPNLPNKYTNFPTASHANYVSPKMSPGTSYEKNSRNYQNSLPVQQYSNIHNFSDLREQNHSSHQRHYSPSYQHPSAPQRQEYMNPPFNQNPNQNYRPHTTSNNIERELQQSTYPSHYPSSSTSIHSRTSGDFSSESYSERNHHYNYNQSHQTHIDDREYRNSAERSFNYQHNDNYRGSRQRDNHPPSLMNHGPRHSGGQMRGSFDRNHRSNSRSNNNNNNNSNSNNHNNNHMYDRGPTNLAPVRITGRN